MHRSLMGATAAIVTSTFRRSPCTRRTLSIRNRIASAPSARSLGRGDPGGYLEIYAPEVTYFDPSASGAWTGSMR